MMKKLLLPAAVTAALLAALFSAPALAQSGEAFLPAPAPVGTASPRDPSKYWPNGELLPELIKGDSAILLDAKTGRVLFEKNADDKRYPASTTKIMTCLLALESGKDFSDIVTIGALPNVDFINNSENIGLKSGEMISFGDLMAGMMVRSGNDAADAIAICVGGSIEHFVEMMNRKAQELGMAGTQYTCTNGLADDVEHYTTPRDMAKLAMAAVKYPEFVKLVGKDSYTMQPDGAHPTPTAWKTTNYLLLDNDYGYMFATGIKTGFTSMAQNSLISSAERDGMSLVAVDMHVAVRNNMWVDSVTMFEFGFNNYDTADLSALLSGQSIPIDIKGAADSDPGQGRLNLHLKPQGPAYVTGRRTAIQDLKGNPSQLRYELSVEKDTAPIQAGEKLGTVTYYYEDAPALVCDLLASREVETPAPAPTPSMAPTKGADNTPAGGNTADTGGWVSILIWAAVAALALVLAALAIRFVNLRRRGGRYRRYDYRQGGGTPRMRR